VIAATIAKAAGVPLKDIEQLNPQLRAGRTPPGQAVGSSPPYPLHVPVGRGITVAKALEVDKSDRNLERYVVRHGDTLEQIAAQHGIAVERIAGVKGLHPLNANNIPGCTYCWPQVASVGMTEAKARAAGREVKVGRFPYVGNGKAIALGDTEGLIKTVFDAKTGELLGAHMIGAEVTELIQGYTIARTLETTEAELMHTVFPHPTLSEMMHESVLDAYGRVVHI
jgi:pyruvate/2-oxoglutarate dehydrogenase complex dihydrolipoamide dehydrogenase (E3) component